MSCGMGMIKYLLFIFNFIFAVCGIGILACGILVRVQTSSVNENIDINIAFPSITLIVLGSIIFVISFFGCCGAIRESHCMTITFASFLLFILLVQVAVAVYAFVVVKNSDPVDVKKGYKNLFDTYWMNTENQNVVDGIQSVFQCCGVNGPQDFEYMNATAGIPWSCCGKTEAQKTCSLSESYRGGCGDEIVKLLTLAGSILGGVAIGIAAVELIGIIFALCLANSIRNAERRGHRV